MPTDDMTPAAGRARARTAFAAVIGDNIPPRCDHPKCSKVEGHTGDHEGWDDALKAMVRTPAEG